MSNDWLKIEAHGDWRHFVDMPEIVFFDEFYDYLEKLEGVEITEFVADGVVEIRLDFEFRGNEFFVDNHFENYRFFVKNPECPDEILLEIIAHFRRLLER